MCKSGTEQSNCEKKKEFAFIYFASKSRFAVGKLNGEHCAALLQLNQIPVLLKSPISTFLISQSINLAPISILKLKQHFNFNS